MNKIKTLIICLIIPFIGLIIFVGLKIKAKEDFLHRAVLAQETRKTLEHLMVNLRNARESNMLNAPADGQWHHQQSVVIAGKIGDLRIRRQAATPDILEVQIQAQSDGSLISNLRIRIR